MHRVTTDGLAGIPAGPQHVHCTPLRKCHEHLVLCSYKVQCCTTADVGNTSITDLVQNPSSLGLTLDTLGLSQTCHTQLALLCIDFSMHKVTV